MKRYNLSELRKSTGYRLFSYATYFCLLLFLMTYFTFAGTSNAILGIFVMLLLFLFYLCIGIGFLFYACIKQQANKEEVSNKTNIIHDLGVIIYFVIFAYFVGVNILDMNLSIFRIILFIVFIILVVMLRVTRLSNLSKTKVYDEQNKKYNNKIIILNFTKSILLYGVLFAILIILNYVLHLKMQ